VGSAKLNGLKRTLFSRCMVTELTRSEVFVPRLGAQRAWLKGVFIPVRKVEEAEHLMIESCGGGGGGGGVGNFFENTCFSKG